MSASLHLDIHQLETILILHLGRHRLGAEVRLLVSLQSFVRLKHNRALGTLVVTLGPGHVTRWPLLSSEPYFDT